jgi:hypothetical protein
MNSKHVFSLFSAAALATLLACDEAPSAAGINLATDCPIGTFRPEGLDECVFPADDQFGNLLGVSDNRCATGQAAVPPSCVHDRGGRPYFSISRTCAPGYTFLPGACRRDFPGTGAAGTTGFAGTGFGENTGVAGTGFLTGSAGGNGATGD